MVFTVLGLLGLQSSPKMRYPLGTFSESLRSWCMAKALAGIAAVFALWFLAGWLAFGMPRALLCGIIGTLLSLALVIVVSFYALNAIDE
jgi:NO-binding membrane sensor protein with MHYT domain